MTKTLSHDELIAKARRVYKAHGLPARHGEKDMRKVLGVPSRKGTKKLMRQMRRVREDTARTLASLPGATSPDTVMTLAQYAPDGVAHAGTVQWDAPAAGAGRVPLGLDDSGKALHALIANRAASTGKHYFDAMADVTGQPDYASLSDIPPALGEQQGLNPEQAGKYSTARGLAASEGIGWMDALGYLDHVTALARLQGDDGSAPVPWLDTRPLATPPRPWSDDDWARDQRRAGAAGIVVGALGPDGQDTQLKSLWQSGAEEGRDVVGEMAQQQRQDAAADLQAQGAGLLDQARAREDDRRSSAINDELQRRARNLVAGNGRPAARRLPGTHELP